tara:strand:- start:4516 stop:5787 length:1272 start_codon:yes stop_codon:yes gene_type:complete
LVILLICSAFFSGCEAAYFSLNRITIDNFKESNKYSRQLVASLLKDPKKLMVTIYVGNELVNVGVAALVTSISISFFGSKGIALAIGFGTFLLLFLGEITPKTFTIRHAEKFSLLVSRQLKFFYTFVYPVQWVITRITETIVSLIGSQASNNNRIITEEEFHTLVSVGENEGVLESDEKEMIHNVIRFGETTAGEVMTPRVDIFSLNADDDLETVFQRVREKFFSRIPVYEKSADNIIGILYIKDLQHYNRKQKSGVKLRGLLHSPFFVPSSKKMHELLKEFKDNKKHIAIVLDEYGALAGVVTLEDVLEELVGDIKSETRKDDSLIVKKNDFKYSLSSMLRVEEFNKEFKATLPEDEFDSIGGFIFGLFGRVPQRGESVAHENFKFTVEKIKGPRILKIIMEKEIDADKNLELNNKSEHLLS